MQCMSYRNCCVYLECSTLQLGSQIDNVLNYYGNLIIMSDFNSELIETYMTDFCEMYNLSNLISNPTCFKNPENPSCIDVIFTNNVNSFRHSKSLETGLSDFHKMTVTVLKMSYVKLKPKVISYTDYKNYSTHAF